MEALMTITELIERTRHPKPTHVEFQALDTSGEIIQAFLTHHPVAVAGIDGRWLISHVEPLEADRPRYRVRAIQDDSTTSGLAGPIEDWIT